MGTDQDHLLLTRQGHVATITLNRPEQFNVWNGSMAETLERMMRQCAEDDAVRVIVVTGAGRVFCAGADLAHLKAAQETGVSPMAARAHSDADLEQRYSYLMGIPKPIICAINGAAVGIGLILALFCDIRYASSSAKLSLVFSRRGLIAEHGLAWLLPRLVGLPRATEMLLFGSTLKADEAERIGLVNAVFADDAFKDEVQRRADDLAANVSPRSTRIMKRQVYEACFTSLATAAHAADAEIPGCIASEDFKEGVRHYLEKRPAAFTGR